MSPDAHPPTSEQLQALAQAALAAGEYPRCMALAQAALAASPDSPQARLLLANAALQLGELDAAIAALQTLSLHLGKPQPIQAALATALNNRGSRKRRTQDEHAALADFESALIEQPTHPQAGFNRALSLLALGQTDAAQTALARHLDLHPDDLEARMHLLLLQADSPERARAVEQLLASPAAPELPAELRLRAHLASQQPQHALALLSEPNCSRYGWALGERLRLDNQASAAREAYARACEVPAPPLRALLAAALAEDPVAESAAALSAALDRQQSALDALSAEWPAQVARADSALDQLAYSPFFLAYQGADRLPLQQQLGGLMQAAAAQQQPQWREAPACLQPRRVLLVGSIFRDCTAGAYFGGWIDWLRAAGFEVVIYQLGPRRDAESERMAAAAWRFEFIEESATLETIAERLRSEGAALLLYPEVGMDARVCALACLRLARAQAMAWGHPASPGLKTLDAYFSCAEMEPDSAPEHYAEPLRLLPGLGVDYRHPVMPTAASRADLGLPERGPLLLAPQSLFKLHPDNDAIYADVLGRVPAAQLLLFADQPSAKSRLLQRLQRLQVDPARLHWLPTTRRQHYLQINAACDLMLDSLHFSGGNASLDALQVGLPVLSCLGDLMRGRQSAAMLARLGLTSELCVGEPARMAARAADLLQSGALPALRAQIKSHLPQLFDWVAARRAFIEHIETLCAQGSTA